MKITVVTVYRDKSGDHYLGAVVGDLPEKEKQALAVAHRCERVNTDAELEEVDQIFFCELDLCETAADLKRLMNIDDENYHACHERPNGEK